MATTSGGAARSALDALWASGITFALLHGEQAIKGDEALGDVDVVSDRPPPRLLGEALAKFRQSGLHPIALWPYDVASAAGLALARVDASEGVQLDVLFDPDGQGKYGVRSSVMLESVVTDGSWPKLSPIPELLYLMRKRAVKRSWNQASALRDELSRFDSPTVGGTVRAMFVPEVAQAVLAVIDGAPIRAAARSPKGHWRRNGIRLAGRLTRPVGFWAEIVGTGSSSVELEVAARFARFLPYVQSGGRPNSWAGEAAWWARRVAPIRWRPGIFISSTDDPGHDGSTSRRALVHADVAARVEEGADSICAKLVRAMEERLLSWCLE